MSLVVRGGSEVGDEHDASFPEIAGEPEGPPSPQSSTSTGTTSLPFALRKEKWSISVTRRRRRDADTLLLGE